jgi:hypothetical protein
VFDHFYIINKMNLAAVEGVREFLEIRNAERRQCFRGIQAENKLRQPLPEMVRDFIVGDRPSGLSRYSQYSEYNYDAPMQ